MARKKGKRRKGRAGLSKKQASALTSQLARVNPGSCSGQKCNPARVRALTKI